MGVGDITPQELEKFYAYVDELCAEIFSSHDSSDLDYEAEAVEL
ncbi:MAG: hypothetical protein ACQESG_05665 [Nanobdellota archaeon]